MTKIISIVNYKGGTGKTTTALNFGSELAGKGNKVLLVDFDGQGNLTKALGIIDNVDKLQTTISTMLHSVMNGIDPELAIYKTYDDNIDLIPCNVQMADTKAELLLAMAREKILDRALSIVKQRMNYDYIIIDNAPSVEIDFINSLVASDEIIIVSSPDTFSAEGINNLLKKYESVVRVFNRDLKITGILVNNANTNTNFERDMILAIKETWKDIKVFQTVIPRSVRVKESQAMNKAIGIYEKKNPAAQAFKAFTEEYTTEA